VTQPDVDGPAHRTGRFPFDPLFDADATPCVTFLMGRALQALATEGTPQRRSLLIAKRRFTPLPPTLRWIVHRILRTVPSMRRAMEASAEARATEDALKAILPEVRRMRALCAQYGVDPTAHPLLSPSFGAIVGYCTFAAFERQTRKMVEDPEYAGVEGADELDRILDEIDVERRVEESHAGMRAVLESEAMANVVSEARRIGPTGVRAMLEQALPEIRSVTLRVAIEELLQEMT
jgi:hypothetical protein